LSELVAPQGPLRDVRRRPIPLARASQSPYLAGYSERDGLLPTNVSESAQRPAELLPLFLLPVAARILSRRATCSALVRPSPGWRSSTLARSCCPPSQEIKLGRFAKKCSEPNRLRQRKHFLILGALNRELMLFSRRAHPFFAIRLAKCSCNLGKICAARPFTGAAEILTTARSSEVASSSVTASSFSSLPVPPQSTECCGGGTSVPGTSAALDASYGGGEVAARTNSTVEGDVPRSSEEQRESSDDGRLSRLSEHVSSVVIGVVLSCGMLAAAVGVAIGFWLRHSSAANRQMNFTHL